VQQCKLAVLFRAASFTSQSSYRTACHSTSIGWMVVGTIKQNEYYGAALICNDFDILQFAVVCLCWFAIYEL